MFEKDEIVGCGGRKGGVGLGVSLKRKGVMCGCLYCSFTLCRECEC